jgi:hypothetical protein
MKRVLRFAAILGLILLGLYIIYPAIRPVNETPTAASVPTNSSLATVSASNAPSTSGQPASTSASPGDGTSGSVAARAGAMAPLVADATAPTFPPAVLESMRRVIQGYNTEFGENPVGNNAEITHALMGENPRHLNFIQPNTGLRVNANGELVDAWGTPFFFHQLSGQDMEIHSAGPDRVMWTSDDLITR